MDELYIKLRKHVYERLDIGRDVADSELYEVIDACIYDEKIKGEEATTKLLMPMMMMLMIVMAIIMIPAVWSFQI